MVQTLKAISLKSSLTLGGAPGYPGRTEELNPAGKPGNPEARALLWMAPADTIWAEDIAAILCKALSFVA